MLYRGGDYRGEREKERERDAAPVHDHLKRRRKINEQIVSEDL